MGKKDILAITETLCKGDVSIKGFKAFHFHRTQLNARDLRGTGGISIFVKKDISKCVSVIKTL